MSRRGLPYLVALLLAALLIYLGMTNGELDVSVPEVLKTLLGISQNSDFELVVFQFRLPRIVLGAMVGFALGLSGAAVQSLTRNPLADPGILGIHSGASLFVVLFMFSFQGIISLTGNLAVMAMPLFGIIGGMLSMSLIYLLAQNRGSFDPRRLILVGIAVNLGFGAMTMYVSLKMNPQDFERAAMWLSGNLNTANWLYIQTILPWLLVLAPLLWGQSRRLDLLRLNDDSLVGLGMGLKQTRNILLGMSVGLTAATVAVAGTIGFVGLIAPHIAYRLVGIHNRLALPLAGLLGMVLVLAGDFIGRTFFLPAQLPVGVVISVIGAPYFVYLLIQGSKPGRGRA
ncbi:FecCD family ABC transporter permease [Paenibacillus senegalimassiliensis]|uniref:FecCD family ABC transporter permease n=1 Tax=Paenibacillus senegalimassiliensis TaxID=1737426 RepID=UPI00073E672E|nr:iron ABC transporter permease [Paenibacillus senegalimassiliensis]